MKLEINEGGYLLLERRNAMKRIYCPYAEETPCGDWCALFHEPFVMDAMPPDPTDPKDTASHTRVYLQLCCANYTVLAMDFVDRRGQG